MVQEAEPSTPLQRAVIGAGLESYPDTPSYTDLDALVTAVADGAAVPDQVILHLPPTTDHPVEATHTLTAHTLTTLQ
ncbi:hypothetical protein, partial [Streptomyces sp. GESEQ-35]|uniref:hypothetical protein n=1 Tax=Streptomyces sp. GESEQ-35 TaxID=2812657 RepID=UPI001FF506B8